MHNIMYVKNSEKILGTTILLILRYSTTLGESDFSLVNSTNKSDFLLRHNLILNHFLSKRKDDYQLPIYNNTIIYNSNDSIKNGSDEPRSYYNSISTTPFISAFDPISVLASLAFLAFLLQSFAALFDRTRSRIPTIINSRQSNFEFNEQFIDVRKTILRALEEYAILGNDLLNNEKKSKTSIS